jgi:cholest-4-en-3-one 26-monooxygenase
MESARWGTLADVSATSAKRPGLDEIDLTDASVWERATPHNWLDQLRSEDPVHWHEESDGPGFWALTRHDDVRQVSTSPGDFSSAIGGPTRLDPVGQGLDHVRMIIIGMDPPEHRTFRSIVSKAFTPKMISWLAESLEAETERVIDELRDGTRCDFVSDVAARIPMWSISELMGVPEADRRRLYELSHALIDDQDPEIAPTPETAEESLTEVFAYASELAERERAHPSDSLSSVLLEAEVVCRSLNYLEFSLFFMFLIVAGIETTRTASTQGLLTLLDHPESLDRLTGDVDLIPSAIEEMLRFEPPIHHFRRTVTADVVLGGQRMAAGDKVLMWYPASNRDPVVFNDPHTFDIDRSPNPQQSFGIGEHFCLGANLARLSLRLLFTKLLDTIENVELEAPPRRLHSNLINGIKEMRVRYDVR